MAVCMCVFVFVLSTCLTFYLCVCLWVSLDACFCVCGLISHLLFGCFVDALQECQIIEKITLYCTLDVFSWIYGEEQEKERKQEGKEGRNERERKLEESRD